MVEFLKVFTELGDSKLLIPVAVLAALCMQPGARFSALRWMVAAGAAGALVLVTKLAFIGWGVGSAEFNFTGISGHAMVSMAIYPVLGFALGNIHSRRAAYLLAGLSTALGLAIGVSRVELLAHSWSEVIVGLALGALVSAWVLRHWPQERLGLRAAPLVVGFLLSSLAGNHMAPKIQTQDLVVSLALELAGHDHPYTRDELHMRRKLVQTELVRSKHLG
jgi:membrane-associated phospholipid phosphatase